MSVAVRMQGIRRRYGRRTILDGIDLDLSPGSRHAVMGPNGAGKTTLLRLAAAQARPSAGRITIEGIDVQRPDARRALGMVGHDAPVYGELTVREHLQWWRRLHQQGERLHTGHVAATPSHGAGTDDAGAETDRGAAPVAGTRGAESIDALLASAGLQRLATRRADRLSRGQRQRLSIAMALSIQPRFLILDEPTTGLDAEGTAWLTQRLRATSATVLLASHDARFAAAIDAQIHHLDHGMLSPAECEPTPRDDVAPEASDASGRPHQPAGATSPTMASGAGAHRALPEER